jgi:DNA-binding XRE family transcriptional regulator
MSANDLSFEEQKNVRTTLQLLRARRGTWKTLAQALGCDRQRLTEIAGGRHCVTVNLAFRVARFVAMPLDAVLAGEYIPTATCPKCGHVPDFSDEETPVD